jgi:UDP-N-acetylglucosamine 2-epimerase (non-hydrolysing)
MIDSLVHCFEQFEQRPMKWALPGLEVRPYFLATIHRPANVDDLEQLSRIIEILQSASELAPVFFVTHPRTRERLRSIEANHRLIEVKDGLQQMEVGYIYVLPPLPYLDFLRTMSISKAVLTDSGGIQEETTYLGIPCLTLRENTERPVTVEMGNNQIVGLDHGRIIASLCRILENTWPRRSIPPLWDGRAAERIVESLQANLPLLHGRAVR